MTKDIRQVFATNEVLGTQMLAKTNLDVKSLRYLELWLAPDKDLQCTARVGDSEGRIDEEDRENKWRFQGTHGNHLHKSDSNLYSLPSHLYPINLYYEASSLRFTRPSLPVAYKKTYRSIGVENDEVLAKVNTGNLRQAT